MAFIEKLTQQILPVWQECYDTDFIQRMGKGTLTEDEFRYYMIQDTIYLRNYARVLAMGIVKAHDLKQVKTFHSLLAFVNEGEGNTRVNYLKKWGMTSEDADQYPEHPDNKAYTDFMMKCAVEGNAAEILYSALPCMFSYYWIFNKLIEEYPESVNGPFGPFILDYSDEVYKKICTAWGQFAEELVQDYSEEHRENLKDIYLRSSQYELAFWKMKESK